MHAPQFPQTTKNAQKTLNTEEDEVNADLEMVGVKNTLARASSAVIQGDELQNAQGQALSPGRKQNKELKLEITNSKVKKAQRPLQLRNQTTENDHLSPEMQMLNDIQRMSDQPPHVYFMAQQQQ